MTTPPAKSVIAESDPYPAAGYAWYVVGALTVVYVFSFIDRQILSLLVRPLRRDIGISDTQISLLLGFAFAVFYTASGIPLGRLADSMSRRTIIAAGFAVWSLFTAGCGLARNFLQMLLLRTGVGVGEAALSPAAYSLISDYFPPHRRATAISVYGMGIYLGAGLALLLGGVVIGVASAQEAWVLPLAGAVRPWQLILLAVGLPGVLLAPLLYAIREPVRRGSARAVGRIPLRQVLSYMGRNRRTFLCHNFGLGLTAFGTYAGGAWDPTFFIRTYGWSAERAGVVLGAIIMIAGSAGIVAGGRFADWLAERGHRDSKMRVAMYATLANVPLALAMYSSPNAALAAVLFVPHLFFTSAPYGVAPAAIQEMMPNAMRGQASALYLLVNTLVGLGLGPTAVALLTDYAFHNDAAIRYSLLIVSASGSLASAAVLGLGLKPFLESLERLKEYES